MRSPGSSVGSALTCWSSGSGFHCTQPFIITLPFFLIWLKYCEKGQKTVFYPFIYPAFDGWMIYDFTSFSTVFQSYQGDGTLIMKCCVQWNYFDSSGDWTRSARSVGQRLTHWATVAPIYSLWRYNDTIWISTHADYQPMVTVCLVSFLKCSIMRNFWYEGHPKITDQWHNYKIGFKYNLLVHSPSK